MPQTFVVPDSSRDLIYLLAPNQPLAAGILEKWAEEIPDTRVTALGGSEIFRFYHLPAARIPALRAELLAAPPLAVLDNGVEFLDCVFPEHAPTNTDFSVITTWHRGNYGGQH